MRAQRLGRYINHKRTAFLLCDVQEKFKQSIHVFPSVVNVSKTLIAASRIFEIPLIVTEQKPTALGHTVEELSALLDVKQDKIYPKTQFSMMIPEVKADLAEVDSVVLFGIEAHVCILQTTLDLLESGKEVHVVVDGTSSSRQWERLVAFNRMRTSGAILTTTESLLFQLMGDSTHPKFREISKLVIEHGKRAIDPDLLSSTL